VTGLSSSLLERLEARVLEWMREVDRPLVLGLCGAQGSGKSTLSQKLAGRLTQQGVKSCVLSLDDLYLSREVRTDLARDIHPLLLTRGVPGTHDVALGIKVLEELLSQNVVALPRFDKSCDNPLPSHVWPVVHKVDLIIFEGWCVAATPQSDSALSDPLNELERNQDKEGTWRCYVNDQLRTAYSALFAKIDRLILLAAPNFEIVKTWRTQQEHGLVRRLQSKERNQERGQSRIMSDEEVASFVLHYERLTRHVLEEMPGIADLTFYLDEKRNYLMSS